MSPFTATDMFNRGAESRFLFGRLIVGVDLFREFAVFFFIAFYLVSKGASEGHGGNKLLKNIVNNSGLNHVKQNFQYAILENYNARVDKKIILERESWWKETLGSRAFGLNAN